MSETGAHQGVIAQVAAYDYSTVEDILKKAEDKGEPPFIICLLYTSMSAIFPSVRAIGEGKGETLFYLTAKTITGTVAQEAFHILREKGLKFKVTAITAKEKLCFQDTPECTPEKCP